MRRFAPLALLVAILALALAPLAARAAVPRHVLTAVGDTTTLRPADTMSSRIKVFFLEPTDQVQVALRRFTHGNDKLCRQATWDQGGHDSWHVIADSAPAAQWPDSIGDHPSYVSHDDPRWPQECSQCGEPFQIDDEWQIFTQTLYRGAPDGQLYTLRDAPVGAMWDAHWYASVPSWRGPDGIALMVKTPGGDWHVDGQCSNCTRPNEEHKCWVRHGDPRTGAVHVDKRGNTCAAGAGSIAMGRYHGFLHDGYLVPG